MTLIARQLVNQPSRARILLRAGLVVVLSVCLVGCKPKAHRRTIATPRASSERDAAEMLKSDFARLNNLPNSFSLHLDPPTILLDARYSSDGQDVQVEIKQAPGIEGGRWNVLELVSDNANFRAIGVRPGDTVKCYLFPDSETRHRQRVTGEVEGQMVNHEATELIVAQVLDDNRLQILGAVTPPRDYRVRIPEVDFAREFGLLPAAMDRIREEGKLEIPGAATIENVTIDAFGVNLPAGSLRLDMLPGIAPGMMWPPKIEVWRVKDDRVRAIGRALGGYARRGEPALGWEPAPDAEELSRLVESFNRWLRSRDTLPRVKQPALLDTLPESLRMDRRIEPLLSLQSLNHPSFEPHEGQLLQEDAWCRDIANWASGQSFDPLPRARRLFDWTVRNVTLTDSPRVLNHRPWQTLLYGQGTAEQRAWVFCWLCRQQRLSSCLIELQVDVDQKEPWLWCAVVDHGQLYLFDPQLGLEVPSAEGVATLAEAVENDALLRRLDLPDNPYPVTAEQAAQATLCLIADPMTISARAAELEKQQGGERSMVLYQDLDATAARLKDLPGVASVALWTHPFENLRRRLRLAASTSALAEKSRGAAAADFLPFTMIPHLWKARTLHFRGLLETEREARKQGVLHDPINDHREAARLYLHPRVRPTDKSLNAPNRDQEQTLLQSRSKADATYWLALLKYDQGAARQSQSWLENDTLDGPYAANLQAGVRYNLARALEAQEQNERAAELLEGDESPQQQGNQLRASRLTEPQDAGSEAPEAEAEESPDELRE